MIQIHGMKKSFDGRLALDIDELTIEDGRKIALLGANGAGKSTFLRILAGTLQADAGVAEFSGGRRENDVIFMPQKPYAFSNSTLRNVTLAMSRATPKDKRDALAMQALEEMGISHLASARGNKLSGGETQRMCLARMIVEPHRLILLDEPTSATDISGEEKIERCLQKYLDRTGSGLIFSTHQPAQALRFADEAIFFGDGRICEFGPVRRLLTSPESAQMARFLRHWKLE